VIRRHVLAALAAGIRAGDDDVARAALRKIDLVLRGRARRRLEAALIDAALATDDTGATDRETARHVQRVAALAIARAPQVDAMDRAGVAAAYAALPAVRASRVPTATIILAVLAASLATVGGFYLWMIPGAASRGYARPLPPPVAGAFREGGVPLEDQAIQELLVGDFTGFVLEVDRDRRSGGMDEGRKAHGAALRVSPVMATRDPALAKAWREMIEMLDRWVYVPASGRAFSEIATEFRHRVRAVSDQLASAGIGYYLEGDVMSSSDTAHAIVYSYRVEEVVFVLAGDKPRRVLSLRRLDHLNLQHTLLGMQSQELGDPVLLLDQIDDHVATQTFPVLAPGASYELADEAWQGTELGVRVAAKAGEAVRREALAALGADADAAGKIAALIAERAKLVESWREELDRRGLRMPSTDKLFIPEGLLDGLDGYVPRYQRSRVAEIEEAIASLGGPRIASHVHQLVAASVRRHEAQHGLDDDREAPLRYPAALEEYLGDAETEDGPRPSVERARAELSAYTSQLANDRTTPELALWNVARFAFNRRTWGTPESYAGVLIAEGLARHLAIKTDGPVIHDREIDRARLAALLLPMTTMSGDQLRAAARAVWNDLYGEAIVAIVDR
jgi:hypothetical protein